MHYLEKVDRFFKSTIIEAIDHFNRNNQYYFLVFDEDNFVRNRCNYKYIDCLKEKVSFYTIIYSSFPDFKTFRYLEYKHKFSNEQKLKETVFEQIYSVLEKHYVYNENEDLFFNVHANIDKANFVVKLIFRVFKESIF
jgi:hypothetical protein